MHFLNLFAHRFRPYLFSFASSLLLCLGLCTNSAAKPFAEYPEVGQFMQEMSKKHKIPIETLTPLFQQIQTNARVIELINKPSEKMAWHQYQKLMLTPERIQAGLAFWQQHQSVLQQAEQTFGVPAEVIVSILGIETFYGKNTGSFSVLEALSTLAFDYPRRANFFKKELEHYVLLTREEKLNPALIKGSYAGAIGAAQFMPSSYRAYAIDFSQSGQKNIIDNLPNAIGSVANYLKSQGWKPNSPVAYLAKISGKRYAQLQEKDKLSPVAQHTLGKLQQHGVLIDNAPHPLPIAQKTPVALIELTGKEKNEHWITCHNFYVITRYNQSTHYAMAVYQLSQSIKKAKEKT